MLSGIAQKRVRGGGCPKCLALNVFRVYFFTKVVQVVGFWEGKGRAIREKTFFWEVVPYTQRLQMMHFESIINLGFLLFKRLSKVIDIVTAYGEICLKFEASELHFDDISLPYLNSPAEL